MDLLDIIPPGAKLQKKKDGVVQFWGLLLTLFSKLGAKQAFSWYLDNN